MYYFSIAACFKNEHHCIKEWIEHYKFHGINHIYLINDFSTPEYETIIQKYIEEGYVTLYHNDIVTKQVGRQKLIYEKYLKKVLKETFWLGVIDLDEFLYSPSEINISNILKKYEKFSSININWIHFGSNGYIKQPESLVNSFIMRAKINQKNVEFQGYKTIIQTSKFISFDIHNSQTKGDKLYLNQDSEELLINHYNLQSFNFYLNVKGKRGDCDNWFDSIGYKRNKELFDKLDKNEELDERLKIQNSLIKDL
jgi:hypothetical protein